MQIKLVNINSTDIVDGRPSIVLGLIWTIILYFQVTLPLLIYIGDCNDRLSDACLIWHINNKKEQRKKNKRRSENKISAEI